MKLCDLRMLFSTNKREKFAHIFCVRAKKLFKLIQERKEKKKFQFGHEHILVRKY